MIGFAVLILFVLLAFLGAVVGDKMDEHIKDRFKDLRNKDD